MQGSAGKEHAPSWLQKGSRAQGTRAAREALKTQSLKTLQGWADVWLDLSLY